MDGDGYPALWSRIFAREGRTGDQHDAYSIAAWTGGCAELIVIQSRVRINDGSTTCLGPKSPGTSMARRLANGFSKKVENHAHSVALFALYYNFVRIHKTLRTTPAMAAGVTKRLWEVSDMVDVLEAWEASMPLT